MKKVSLLNEAKGGKGGGWSFVDNFIFGLGKQYTPNMDEADTLLIPSASMVSRGTVEKYYGQKKIILRVDNYLKNSRNRGTGMSRMKDYAKMADVIVYQSEWARGYLQPILEYKEKSRVILNGSNEYIFNKDGEKYPDDIFSPRYLYVRMNRDETKGWHLAHYTYQVIQRQEPNAQLWIVGAFSPENLEYKFDFDKERINFFGIVNPSELAKIYRSCDQLLFPYFNDACSNVLNEAILCGLKIRDCYGMTETGGSPEVINSHGRTIGDMLKQYNEIL